jgi:hypothetical protein
MSEAGGAGEGGSFGGAAAGDTGMGAMGGSAAGGMGGTNVNGGASGAAAAAGEGGEGGETAACTSGLTRCEGNGKLSVCKNGGWEVSSENFNFNPEHCGGCGHSCLGGDCSAGQCQPISVAAGESTPTGLTVDDSFVYFIAARSGFIKRVDKSGAALPETIANNRTGWPRDIVKAASNLYFTEGAYVYRLVPDGSKLPEVWYNGVRNSTAITWELATDSGQAGVSAAQTSIIWWDPTYVLSGTAAAATVQGAFVEQGGPGDPGDVAIDKSFFFWSRRGNGHNNGYVRAMTRAATPTSTTVATVGHPVALAFDGNYLYWASMGVDDETTADTTDLKPASGAIYRAAFVTGTQTWQAPELVVQNIESPWDIVVDANWVYWTSYNEGTVNKVAKAGGAKIPLATGEVMPFNLAQDAVSIYWTRSIHPSGGVARLAK